MALYSGCWATKALAERFNTRCLRRGWAYIRGLHYTRLHTRLHSALAVMRQATLQQ